MRKNGTIQRMIALFLAVAMMVTYMPADAYAAQLMENDSELSEELSVDQQETVGNVTSDTAAENSGELMEGQSETLEIGAFDSENTEELSGVQPEQEDTGLINEAEVTEEGTYGELSYGNEGTEGTGTSYDTNVKNLIMENDAMTWDGLQSAVNNASEGDVIVLGNSLECDTDKSIRVNGKKITLDLNGHTLNRNRESSSEDGHVLVVSGGSELTVTDSADGGKVTGGNANNGGGIKIEGNSTCILNKITITENKAANEGGGIYIESGSLIMNGGAISGNKAGDAGGILNNGGSIVFDGVLVNGNTSTEYGGSGINNKGSAIIKNCTITNNKSVKDGAGVYTDSDITIENCIISSNTTDSYGAGVRVLYGTATITGCTIDGNTAYTTGGGIAVGDDGKIVLSGGTKITGNTGYREGGGIWVGSTGNVDISGVVEVSGNPASGIFLSSGRKLIITGPLSEGNNKSVIDVVLGNQQGVFTSGYTAYNEGVDPYEFFTPESGCSLVLDGNEAKVITSLWGELQHRINIAENNSVISLDRHYKAQADDNTLTIPEGKIITINLNGYNIDRGLKGYTADGEAITVKGNLTIADTAGGGTISGGYGDGGGVCVYTDGSFTLEGGSITGNSGNQNGGGILVHEGGSAILEGGKVENNKAPNGGGIYSAGSLEVRSSASVNNNSATNGGGIYVAEKKTTVNGAAITSNSADKGGGVYIAGGGNTLEISDCSIRGNNAVTEGGGVWHGADSRFSIHGAVTVNDNDSVQGSNILLKEGCVVNITGDITGSSLDLMSDNINIALTNGLTESTPDGTETEEYAKSIFTYGGVDYSTALEVRDNELYHKAVTADDWVDNWKALREYVSDGSHEGKTVALSRDIDAGDDNEVIMVDGGNIKDVTVDLNGHKMDRKGDGDNNDRVFRVQNGAHLTVKDSVGTGVITGGLDDDDGGAFSIEDEASGLNLENVIIRGNRAQSDGGAILVRGTLTMTGGAIIGNKADDTGGAIYCTNSGKFTLTNVIISGNEAENDGGAFNIHLRNDATIDSCHILNNRSKTEDGGAIRLDADNKTLLIKNTEIGGNSCENNGGAMIIDAGNIVMHGGSVSDNTGEDGGGIYNPSGSAELYDVTFSGNRTTKMSGGALNNKSYTYAENCTFNGNRSSDAGGAIYNKSDLKVKNCTFSGNKTEDKGGAIFSKAASLIESCTFDSNEGKQGGAIYLSDSAMTVSNPVMTNNKAKSDSSTKGRGGAIYIEDGDTVIDGGSITNNYADYEGSGIYADTVIKIKGALRVQDNTHDNLFLSGEKLNVAGDLTGAVIGIKLEDETGTFTMNFKSSNPDMDPADIFKSDEGYSVIRDSAGEGYVAESQWPQLQKLINETAMKDTGSGDAPVLVLDRDWNASDSDVMLTIPAGKRLVIDLNGHILNRNRSSKKEEGQTFRVDDGNTLTIKDSSEGRTGTIAGGFADNGGAILLKSGAICNIEGGNFTDNRAVNGGAIYAHGGSTLNITGGSFFGNFATNGGAIYMADDGIATVNITDSIIIDNEASVEGGAVRAGEQGRLNVSGKPFIKGNKGSTGKNILLGAGNVLNITGELTASNGADGAKIDLASKNADTGTQGSGARLTNGLKANMPAESTIDDYAKAIFTYDEGSFENMLQVKEDELCNKDVKADVWVSDWAALQAAIKDEANKDSVIGIACDLTASGNDDRLLHDNNWTVTVELNGHTVNRNRSNNNINGHVFEIQNGGSLIIKDSAGTGIITGGYATRGGGIHVGKDSLCRIEGGTVCGNKADVDGGGIYVRGTLIMNGGAVSNNYADDTAGGIYCQDTGTFSLSNVLISENTSNNDGGGLIVHLASDASITDSRIVNNKSNTEDGGAMRMEAMNKTLTITDTEISGNRAENDGGAIVIYNGSIVMNGGCISGNTAEDGGGVYNDDGTIEFTNVTINANNSYKKGGAGINNRKNATLTDCIITNNAGKADGGGIYTTKPMTITGGEISGNRADGKGGGIYNDKDTTVINGTVFTDNRADGDGGAIYANDDMELSNCEIRSNSTRKSGGAIRIHDCKVTFSNCEIRDNGADEYGGAVYINNGRAEMTIGGGNITNNFAALQGAGIYANKDTDGIYISGNAGIYGNIGTGDVYLCNGKKLTITGSLLNGKEGSTSYAHIGVITEEGPEREFTDGYSEYNKDTDPATFFYSNNKYEVYLKDGSEAAFRSAEKVTDEKPFIVLKDRVIKQWKNLNGSNWMSGISGERYLNEINMPGTHDSGTKIMKGNANTSIVGKIVSVLYGSWLGDKLYEAVTDRFAECQERFIYEQLEDGIRRNDLRLCNYYVSNEKRKDNGKDLWIIHGKEKATGTYFAQDNEGNWLTLDTVFNWYKEFLKENPTETILVTTDAQGIGVDEDEVKVRLQRHIRALAQEINPSTGEPYLYTEDGDYTKKFTRQPKLKEVRGKIIIGLGKDLGVSGGVIETGGSFHDDAKTKIQHLTAFYEKYGFDPLPTNAGKAAFDYYLSAGTNGTDETNLNSPLDIAKKVLPVLFGDGGLLTDRIGKFIGLVNMDGETAKVSRQVWITNFFDGLEYCTVISKESEDDKYPKSYTVLRNTPVTIPECIYDNPNKDGKYFQCWEASDDSGKVIGTYYPGDELTVTGDVTTFTAIWEQTDYSSVRAIWVDADDADGIRPNKLQVTVTKKPETEGTEPETSVITLTAADKVWRKDLDFAVSEVKVTDPEGYTSVVQGTTVRLTHTPEKSVKAAGTVEWRDNDNAEGKRPSDITLSLYSDGEWVKELKVTQEDDWAYDFGNLPLYSFDPDKNTVKKITYELRQNEIQDYATYISGLITSGPVNEQGFEITNSLNTTAILLEGALVWADDDNSGKKRPESVKVSLWANDSVKDSIDVTEDTDGRWTFAFTMDKDIPVSEYSVIEDKIEGYDSDIRMIDRDEDGEFDAVLIVNKLENHEHTIKEYTETTKEPSCEEPGECVRVEFCATCAEIISEKKETIEPLDHDWGKWITRKSATETLEGLEERECKRCSHVESHIIPATGDTRPDSPATVINTATVKKGGNTVDLAGNVIKNGAAGVVSYEISGEPNGCSLAGSVLTSGNITGTVTVNVTVAADDKYKALAATPVTVTIEDKSIQTITAGDVTVTYGDTDRKVSAVVSVPETGSGAISYAVKEGSRDYIDVDPSTGVLTIKKAGTATVVVTAAETGTCAQTVKEVTVTIDKAVQAAPVGLTGNKIKLYGNNGEINGVNDRMEYSVDGGETWTHVSEGVNSITGLKPGTVKVRMAETENYKAGEEADVEIEAYSRELIVYFAEGTDDGVSRYVTFNKKENRYEHEFTGAKICPSVVVEGAGELLREGVDYSLAYSNNTTCTTGNKTAAVKITGKGDYDQTKTLNFTIVPRDLDASSIVVTGMIVNEGQKIAPALFYNGYKLKTGDYTVTSTTGSMKFKADDTEPKLTFTGKGNFRGSMEAKVTVIGRKDIKPDIKVTLKKDVSRVYNGEPQELTITDDKTEGELTVTDAGGKILSKGTDYAVSYSANVNAGIVNVTVNGIGGYTGTVKKSFRILSYKDTSKVRAEFAEATDPAATYEFRKEGVRPAVIVTSKLKSNEGVEREVQLKEGVDYKVTYSGNKKTGTDTAGFRISFMGNYKGTKELGKKFSIVPAGLENAEVVIPDVSKAVKEDKDGIKISYRSDPYVSIGNVKLAKNKDYTVSYWMDGKDISKMSGINFMKGESVKTITVRITGKDSYRAENMERTYKVCKVVNGAETIDLGGARIVAKGTAKAVGRQKYTGMPVKPEIDVMIRQGKEWVLLADDRYRVSYVNNLNRDATTIVVNGVEEKGTVGSRKANFIISKGSLKDAKEAILSLLGI